MNDPNSVESFIPLLGQLGIAGVWLWLFVKGILVTGTEAGRWRQAYESKRAARIELEKALAVERERANVAVTNGEVNRQMLEAMKSAREGRIG